MFSLQDVLTALYRTDQTKILARQASVPVTSCTRVTRRPAIHEIEDHPGECHRQVEVLASSPAVTGA